MLGQGLDHLHAVVEHPGDFEDRRPAAQGLPQLLGSDFPVGQQHGGFDPRRQIRAVEGGGGGRVAGGGADGQDLRDRPPQDHGVDVAKRARHAPVLERCARVLAVVFEKKFRPGLVAQGTVRGDEGRVAFAQVDHRLQRDHRPDELVVAVDALEGRQGQHLAVIEDTPPQTAGDLLEPRPVQVLDQQHLPAFRAHVEQLLDAELPPAPQAAVDHPARVRGQQMGLNVCGKVVQFHVGTTLIASIPPA